MLPTRLAPHSSHIRLARTVADPISDCHELGLLSPNSGLVGLAHDIVILFNTWPRTQICSVFNGAIMPVQKDEWMDGYLLDFIIPLRPYLEKIKKKGCRRQDIFHIRPWACWDALYLSVSACVLNVDARVSLSKNFTPHFQSCSWIFRAIEASLDALFLLVFELTSYIFL